MVVGSNPIGRPLLFLRSVLHPSPLSTRVVLFFSGLFVLLVYFFYAPTPLLHPFGAAGFFVGTLARSLLGLLAPLCAGAAIVHAITPLPTPSWPFLAGFVLFGALLDHSYPTITQWCNSLVATQWAHPHLFGFPLAAFYHTILDPLLQSWGTLFLIIAFWGVAFVPHLRRPRPLHTPPPSSPLKRTEKAAPPKPLLTPTKAHTRDGYTLPSSQLLTPPQHKERQGLQEWIDEMGRKLQQTFESFGIEATMGPVYAGPTVVLFEVTPASGVKVQRIKALEHDIALNLQAQSLRIIAPIPGKGAVGIEIPSGYPQPVSLRHLWEEFVKAAEQQTIPLLLGETVTGTHVVSDLTKMPHLIIAGATGSGKSVCINTIITSLLLHATPDDVRLLMVDPKKVELSSYSPLPHMLAPVITEPHGAYEGLCWLVKEMERRYELLRQLGIRNITAFNQRERDQKKEEELDIDIPEKLPYIVGIIDEFADLMMVSQCDIETPITRIAQMARAVGIHLILATQRPSREVITGLIKANFPTRIAFKVSSRINSQIIIDEPGAENLLGNGDMLFLPPGSANLLRAQGAYVSDKDIHKLIRWCCDQRPTHYVIDSFDTYQSLASADPDSVDDPLYNQAKTLVQEMGQASATLLQRKFKIGYARAASLIDALESNGIVGPAEGAKPRRVFLSNDT